MSGGWTLEAGASLREEARGDVCRQEDDRVASAPDAGVLAVAIELADQALRGLSLPHSTYAGLLSDLYEGVRMRMPYRELMDFARVTALRAARGAGGPDEGEATAMTTDPVPKRATG